jgi:ankyrin repeat protein
MADSVSINTERLCQAIVSSDLKAVQEILDQEETNVNHRHCSKRTPLHIACQTSSPEVVQLLVDHGAKIAARMEDGKTALHLAAAQGKTEIIRILRAKSDLNKEAARENGKWPSDTLKAKQVQDNEDDREKWTDEMVPLVKVKLRDVNDLAPTGNYLDDEYELSVDVLDPDEICWELFMSPLHDSILNGHFDAVRELVSFGADVKKPIKQYEDIRFLLCQPAQRPPNGAILTLALPFLLEKTKTLEMVKALIQLGASPAEADLNRTTPLHYIAAMKDTIPLSTFLEASPEETLRAIEQLSIGTPLNGSTYSALTTAILTGNIDRALDFLEAGAKPRVAFRTVISTLDSAFPGRRSQFNPSTEKFNNALAFKQTQQPIIAAVENDFPLLAIRLLEEGADPNTHRFWIPKNGLSVLDITRQKIGKMRGFLSVSHISEKETQSPSPVQHSESEFLDKLDKSSYTFWATERVLARARQDRHQKSSNLKVTNEDKPEPRGTHEKRQIIQERLCEFERLEKDLVAREAKLFRELHPPNPDHQNKNRPPAIKDDKPHEPFIFLEEDIDTEAYMAL